MWHIWQLMTDWLVSDVDCSNASECSSQSEYSPCLSYSSKCYSILNKSCHFDTITRSNNMIEMINVWVYLKFYFILVYFNFFFQILRQFQISIDISLKFSICVFVCWGLTHTFQKKKKSDYISFMYSFSGPGRLSLLIFCASLLFKQVYTVCRQICLSDRGLRYNDEMRAIRLSVERFGTWAT